MFLPMPFPGMPFGPFQEKEKEGGKRIRMRTLGVWGDKPKKRQEPPASSLTKRAEVKLNKTSLHVERQTFCDRVLISQFVAIGAVRLKNSDLACNRIGPTRILCHRCLFSGSHLGCGSRVIMLSCCEPTILVVFLAWS